MVSLMGLCSQYSVRFEKGKRVGESTELHHDTLALVCLSLEVLSMSRSPIRFDGRKSPPLRGGHVGSNNRELANQILWRRTMSVQALISSHLWWL